MKWTYKTVPWPKRWSTMLTEASTLEPRWVRGHLLWLLQWKPEKGKGDFRWLIEILDNGEPDLWLQQCLHAGQWEAQRKLKGQSNERKTTKQE